MSSVVVVPIIARIFNMDYANINNSLNQANNSAENTQAISAQLLALQNKMTVTSMIFQSGSKAEETAKQMAEKAYK
jgi:hypothetical protein